MSIHRILVPTDFSDYSETALAIAVSVGKRMSAELNLLHVTPPPGGFAIAAPEPLYLSPQFIEAVRSSHAQKVQEQLLEIEARFKGQLSITTLSRSTNIVEGIAGFAAETGTDLIVMGSQGRGASRFLVGSVAEKVTRCAACPVLVTREPIADNQVTDINKILVAIDYSSFSCPAALFAAAMLVPGGTLEFLHVWDEPYLGFAEYALDQHSAFFQMAEEHRSQQVERLREFVTDLKLTASTNAYVSSGSPPKAILERGEKVGADLIVVGAHSSESVTQRILGTVADRVLRHARTPVLLFPEAARSDIDKWVQPAEPSTRAIE